MIHALLLRIIALSVFSTIACGGSVAEGGNCSTTNNHLDPATHKFMTDCDDRTFCAASSDSSTVTNADSNGIGICSMKRCRTDEFPFGFNTGDVLPPLCDRGFYCPDEGGGCEALLAPGSACQLNRDAQCSPPEDWQRLASSENFNGSVCLQSVCMYANVTLGLACVIESTTYVGFDSGTDGQPYNTTVIRDNCWSPLLYCESSSLLCEKTNVLGQACQMDRECRSTNCGPAHICIDPPGMPVKVKPWLYALTCISILTVMTSICIFLTLGHKRDRMARYYELQQYYFEQTSLRASIIALHSAAAKRVLDEKKADIVVDDGRNHVKY